MSWRTRAARRLRPYRWAILAVMWTLGLALAYVGFARNAAALGRERSPLDLVYVTLQLIGLGSGAVDPPVSWQFNVARFLLPTLTAITLLQGLAALFREQLAVLRLWRISNHIVICGLSHKGWLLASGFLQRGERIVVIEADDENDKITPCRQRGAVVLIGDATDAEQLARAGVGRAQRVIAVTGDDGTNAEVALRCQTLLERRGAGRRSQPLICTIHLVDPQLSELARGREMSAGEHPSVHVEMFNTFDRGGALLWQTYGRGLVSAESGAPHLLVAGLGGLGESLVVHAAKDWYGRTHGIPQLCEGGDDALPAQGSMRITVLDREAGSRCRALLVRYPRLADACDLEPQDMEMTGPEFAEAAFLNEGPGCPSVGAAFVCFDDDSLSLRTGLAIHRSLRQRCTRAVPVIVRMAKTGGLSTLLDSGKGGAGLFDTLHAFSLLELTCRPGSIEGTHDILPRTMHEEYVHTRTAAGDAPQGDPSLKPWSQLDAALQRSNVAKVDSVYQHLRKLGYALEPLTDWQLAAHRFSDDEVERLAELEHARFVAERSAAGWAYVDGAKNAAALISPTLVDWAQLPDEEKAKDRAFARALPGLLAKAGFQIARQAR